jgi:hypothetical protein
MLGIEAIEAALFFKQVGLAVAGASAMWGMVLKIKSDGAGGKEKKDTFRELSELLLIPLSVGVAVAIVAWAAVLLINVPIVAGHEGIVVEVSGEDEIDISGITTALFTLLALTSLIGFAFYKSGKDKFKKVLKEFYAIEFAILALLVSFPVWTGGFGKEQLFLIGHNAHSILTIGTVIALDFIFFASESVNRIKRHLYPFLPNISKVIWVGLGIEFVSVSFIFSGALELTPRFFFIQTIIGIIIVNGAFLAGPVNRKLVSSVKGNKAVSLSKNWETVVGVSGAISITSWTAVTFIDFLKNVTATYWELATLYIGLLIIFYLSYQLVEKYKPRF